MGEALPVTVANCPESFHLPNPVSRQASCPANGYLEPVLPMM